MTTKENEKDRSTSTKVKNFMRGFSAVVFFGQVIPESELLCANTTTYQTPAAIVVPHVEKTQPTQYLRTIHTATPTEKHSDKFSHLDSYDSIINAARGYYRRRLGIDIPANRIKAMIEVESGRVRQTSQAFAKDPIQVANMGDYALPSAMYGAEGMDIVCGFTFSKELRQTPFVDGKLDYSNSNMTPSQSICIGTAWLIDKMAVWSTRTVENGPEMNYVIRSGDSFAKIAGELGTTIDSISRHNPKIEDITTIYPGQQIKYVSAHVQTYIAAWKSLDEATQDYNGGGDPEYLAKVKNIESQLDVRRK